MTVSWAQREKQSGSRASHRAGSTSGREVMVSKKHCASGAVFAPETHWAKLWGKRQMSLKARRQMPRSNPPPAPKGCRKVCELWEKESRNVFEKSERGGSVIRTSEEQSGMGMRQPERMEGLLFWTEMVGL